MIDVGIILGSTRPNRNGEAVAQWAYEFAVKRGDANFEPIDVADYALPLLDEAMPPVVGQYANAHTRQWAEKVASLDAFVFVTPEYNHGTSGAMKNAIDFLYQEWVNKGGIHRLWQRRRRPRGGEPPARDGLAAGCDRGVAGVLVDPHRFRAVPHLQAGHRPGGYARHPAESGGGVGKRTTTVTVLSRRPIGHGNRPAAVGSDRIRWRCGRPGSVDGVTVRAVASLPDRLTPDDPERDSIRMCDSPVTGVTWVRRLR